MDPKFTADAGFVYDKAEEEY